MSDSKQAYSDASRAYIENDVPTSELDKKRYEGAKAREREFNDQWERLAVDINEVRERFVPGVRLGRRQGYKYVFENARYMIKADMVAGYLRIYDKELKEFVNLAGVPGEDPETHFKIKKRKDMR